jgi:hypothetical protein
MVLRYVRNVESNKEVFSSLYLRLKPEVLLLRVEISIDDLSKCFERLLSRGLA